MKYIKRETGTFSAISEAYGTEGADTPLIFHISGVCGPAALTINRMLIVKAAGPPLPFHTDRYEKGGASRLHARHEVGWRILLFKRSLNKRMLGPSGP